MNITRISCEYEPRTGMIGSGTVSQMIEEAVVAESALTAPSLH